MFGYSANGHRVMHGRKECNDRLIATAVNDTIAHCIATALNALNDPAGMACDLNQMVRMIHERNVAAGWWTNLETGEPLVRNDGEMIALMHSELSEALEGVRKNQMDDHLPNRPMVEVEMADTIIRIMDYCGGRGLDLGGALVEKLEYNANRLDHKRESRMKADGKKI